MDAQSPEPQSPAPMNRKRLLIATVGGLVVAALIVFGAILLAEFDKDPLGVGKLSGISKLWAPEEKTVDVNRGAFKRARFYEVPYRTDVVEILLTGPSGGNSGLELEYKVRMKTDATLVYAWEVVDPKEKDSIHYDFHGHTVPSPLSGESMVVASYRQAYGNTGQGGLTSPFDGIQGWQFTNTTDKPIVVRVRLAGFYTLIQPGDPGNEAGVLANLPAAKARPWLTDPAADIENPVEPAAPSKRP